jgi:hypothetical protein
VSAYECQFIWSLPNGETNLAVQDSFWQKTMKQIKIGGTSSAEGQMQKAAVTGNF